MSYVIKAYKKGSKLNIPVEDKHKYNTQAEAHNYYTFQATIPSKKWSLIPYTAAYTDLGAAGYGAVWNDNKHNIELLWTGEQLSTQTGTGVDQRIGNKIFLKNLTILINIYLTESAKRFFNAEYVNFTDLNTDGTTLAGFTNHLKEEGKTPAKFKFRLMLIKFDDAMDKTNIVNWFNTIYVPQYYGGNGITMPAISNQSKMLRESCNYTGKFRIMYDKSFSINSKKGHKFIKFSYDFKRNLTADDINGKITDDDFKNLRLILFSPTLLNNDINGIALSKFSDYLEKTVSLSNAATLRNWVVDAFWGETNIKYKYYDL